MVKMFGKNNSRHQRGGVSKQLLLLLVSFLTGYLSASIFDFTSASNWVNAHLLAQQALPAGKQNLSQQVQLPKPKFEFYTMLANDHVDTPAVQSQVATVPSPVPAPAPVTTTPMDLSVTKAVPTTELAVKPIANAAPSVANDVNVAKGNYMLQVAAFKKRLDAEHIKATLALKGFSVRVVSVSQQQTIWYRVLIGPFSTREEAQRAQASVAQSTHIMGIVRKMDA